MTQNFQDISWLSTIAHQMDFMAKNNQNQISALKRGIVEPHIFDDRIINRTIQAYSQAREHCIRHGEQLNCWLAQSLNPDQRSEVERLVELNQRILAGNEHILDLCSKIKQGTIDRIMEKNDFELGFESLTGKRKPPNSLMNERLAAVKAISMPVPVQRFEASLAIHQFVESILAEGGGDSEIINNPKMIEFATQFWGIANSAQPAELDGLKQMFSGFQRFAQVIKNMMDLMQQFS